MMEAERIDQIKAIKNRLNRLVFPDGETNISRICELIKQTEGLYSVPLNTLFVYFLNRKRRRIFVRWWRSAVAWTLTLRTFFRLRNRMRRKVPLALRRRNFRFCEILDILVCFMAFSIHPTPSVTN